MLSTGSSRRSAGARTPRSTRAWGLVSTSRTRSSSAMAAASRLGPETAAALTSSCGFRDRARDRRGADDPGALLAAGRPLAQLRRRDADRDRVLARERTWRGAHAGDEPRVLGHVLGHG